LYAVTDDTKGLMSVANVFACQKYIVNGIDEFRLTGTINAWTGFPLAVYTDENDNYIGCELMNETNITLSVTDKLLTVPHNAKYLYANSRSTLSTVKRTYSRIDQLERDEPTDNQDDFEVNITPIHGQSLSLAIGTAVPALHTSPIQGGLMMYNGVYQVDDPVANMTKIDMLSMGHDSYYQGLNPEAQTYESSAWGTAERIKTLCDHDKGLLPHEQQFYSACGQDGGSIATQFDTELTTMQNIFNSVKALIPYKRTGVPAIYYIQGEADNNAATAIETYKTALKNGMKSISTLAKSIFEQVDDVRCIIYQTSYSKADRTHYTASQAQMELCRDEDYFAPSCPAYVLIKSPNDDKIHISNWGEYLLGQYQGIQFYNLVVKGKKNVGVMPLKNKVSYNGNKITIQFAVEVPPLRFVTDWVSERTHYGFEVIRSGNDIVQSVEISGIDSVVLTCSSDIQAGDEIYYAMQPVAYGNHLEGSGGNLCDSQGDTLTATIDDTSVALNNYCYAFSHIIQ
jgi:hypothetical protein